MSFPDPRMIFDYCCARLGIDPRDDRGLTTTEVIILTVLLAGMAIVVAGVIYNVATNTADNIPTPAQPGG